MFSIKRRRRDGQTLIPTVFSKFMVAKVSTKESQADALPEHTEDLLSLIPSELITFNIVSQLETYSDFSAFSVVNKLLRSCILLYTQSHGTKLDKMAVGLLKKPGFIKKSPGGFLVDFNIKQLLDHAHEIVITHMIWTSSRMDVSFVRGLSWPRRVIQRPEHPSRRYEWDIGSFDVYHSLELRYFLKDGIFKGQTDLCYYLAQRAYESGYGHVNRAILISIEFRYGQSQVPLALEKRKANRHGDQYHLRIEFKLLADKEIDMNEVLARLKGISPLTNLKWKKSLVFRTSYQFTMNEILQEGTWYRLANKKWLESLSGWTISNT